MRRGLKKSEAKQSADEEPFFKLRIIFLKSSNGAIHRTRSVAVRMLMLEEGRRILGCRYTFPRRRIPRSRDLLLFAWTKQGSQPVSFWTWSRKNTPAARIGLHSKVMTRKEQSHSSIIKIQVPQTRRRKDRVGRNGRHNSIMEHLVRVRAVMQATQQPYGR